MKPIVYMIILIILISLFFNMNSGETKIGLISNASLTISNSQSVSIFGLCNECICMMIANVAYFALNCLPNNRTCQLFLTRDQNKQFSIQSDSKSLFYFLSLPNYTMTNSKFTMFFSSWNMILLANWVLSCRYDWKIRYYLGF